MKKHAMFKQAAGIFLVLAACSLLVGQTYRILVRQGLKTNLPTLSVGELGFATDTKELFIGASGGNVYAAGQDLRTTAGPTFSLVKVGAHTPAQGSQIWVGYDYTTEAGWHAYEDETLIANHGGHGYASFDAMPTMNGTGPYNHLVGFQSRPIYNSSGSLTNYLDGVNVFPVHSGAGTIAAVHGVRIMDVGGVGPITADYGIYIEDIWRGATNFSLYSAGPAKSYFGGYVGFGIAPALDLIHVFHASAPNIRTSFTSSTGAGGLDNYNDGGVRGMAKMLGTAFSLYGGASCFALINTAGPIAASPSGLTSPTFYLSSTNAYLRAGTSDGSDNSYLELAGGGAASTTRGGMINIFGNEHTQKGSFAIIAGVGDGSSMGNILFYGGNGPAELARFNQDGNFGLGLTTWGTSATKTFAQATGTAPTTSPADSYQQYSADAGAIAGQAGPHFRTEGGGIFAMRSDTGTTLQYVYQKDNLADDGTVTLPDATSGMVLVSCNGEAGMWLVQADGTVTKISGSANTAAADTDANLCVYDGGTGATVKNRLGATGEIRIVYYYN
jgi:hypothetical protein